MKSFAECCQEASDVVIQSRRRVQELSVELDIASAKLEAMEAGIREVLFNLRRAVGYEAANPMVIRESADRLEALL